MLGSRLEEACVEVRRGLLREVHLDGYHMGYREPLGDAGTPYTLRLVREEVYTQGQPLASNLLKSLSAHLYGKNCTMTTP